MFPWQPNMVEGDIDNTNQEGRTRSGINTRVGPRPECRPRRGARGSGPTRVLIPTRVQYPQGWYCIYQIFQHLNNSINRFICEVLPCKTREDTLPSPCCLALSVSDYCMTSCAELSQLSALSFAICIHNIYMYLILKFDA